VPPLLTSSDTLLLLWRPELATQHGPQWGWFMIESSFLTNPRGVYFTPGHAHDDRWWRNSYSRCGAGPSPPSVAGAGSAHHSWWRDSWEGELQHSPQPTRQTWLHRGLAIHTITRQYFNVEVHQKSTSQAKLLSDTADCHCTILCNVLHPIVDQNQNALFLRNTFRLSKPNCFISTLHFPSHTHPSNFPGFSISIAQPFGLAITVKTFF